MHISEKLCTFVGNYDIMLLGLLLSLLSTTFTVSGRNSITTTDSIPENSTYAYSSTATSGKIGQMTAGNSTTLCLTGWQGCEIQSVTLSMHSNSTAGAGELQMTIGDDVVWEIPEGPFAQEDWYGSYTSAFVDISHEIQHIVGHGEDITISIRATVNSLYIASYTIVYTPPVPQAYSVILVSGLVDNPAALTESVPRRGVTLPQLADTLYWRFIGWSETEVLEGENCPNVYLANTQYYPTTDCTLYAVYLDTTTIAQQVTNWQSGDYVLVHNSSYWGSNAMWGEILPVKNTTTGRTVFYAVDTTRVMLDTLSNGMLLLLSDAQEDMVYYIDFLTDSTLTITHNATNTYIGYKKNDLAKLLSEWKYRVLSDGSLSIYFPYQKDWCYLTAGPGKNAVLDEYVFYLTQCNPETPQQYEGITLFPVVSQVYTTWPFGKFDAVENVRTSTSLEDVIVTFGCYQLHIRNGKKYLVIK